MDRFINNELNTISNEKNDEINKFMKELQFELEDKKSKISIDKSLYDKIYNELELAPLISGHFFKKKVIDIYLVYNLPFIIFNSHYF